MTGIHIVEAVRIQRSDRACGRTRRGTGKAWGYPLGVRDLELVWQNAAHRGTRSSCRRRIMHQCAPTGLLKRAPGLQGPVDERCVGRASLNGIVRREHPARSAIAADQPGQGPSVDRVRLPGPPIRATPSKPARMSAPAPSRIRVPPSSCLAPLMPGVLRTHHDQGRPMAAACSARRSMSLAPKRQQSSSIRSRVGCSSRHCSPTFMSVMPVTWLRHIGAHQSIPDRQAQSRNCCHVLPCRTEW